MSKKKKAVIILLTAAVLTAAVLACAIFLRQRQGGHVQLRLISSPADAVCENGYSVSFSVKAEGNSLSYTWECLTQKGSWGTVKGSSAELYLAVSMAMNGNRYRCTVTDGSGNSVQSDEAVLTVTSEHTYGEAAVTKSPTCLTGGQCVYVCSSCNEKMTEELPANGHNFDESVSYTGKRQYKCSVCAYTFETDLTDKSALEAALDKIPRGVAYYYEGAAAKTLAAIENELQSTVFGVKNADRLTQAQADDYTERLTAALDALTLKTGSSNRVYISTQGEDITLEGTAAYITLLQKSKVITENQSVRMLSYTDYSGEKSYKAIFGEETEAFGITSAAFKIVSCGYDRSCVRTLAANEIYSILSGEAPRCALTEVYINGSFEGVFTVLADDALENADAEAFSNAFSQGISFGELEKTIDVDSFSRWIISSYLMGLGADSLGYSRLYSQNGKIYAALPESFAYTCGNEGENDSAADIFQNSYISSLWKNMAFRREVLLMLSSAEEELDSLLDSGLYEIFENNIEIIRRQFTDTDKSLYDDAGAGFSVGETVEANFEYLKSCLKTNLDSLKEKIY